MKHSINLVAAILFIVGCCAGCSKESNKTPVQVNNDVVALLQQNKTSEALKMAENALKKAEKENGAEHRVIAEYLQTLALVYTVQGEKEKAEAEYQKALSIITKTQGNDSIEAAKILNNLAAIFYSSKDYDKAVSYYKQSLAIAEKKFPPGDPRVEAIQNNINTCEGIISGKAPLPATAKKETPDNVPDLVPEQVKEAAISDLSKQNIIISGLMPMPPINMDDKGMIFPYIAIKGGGTDDKGGMDEKVVVLFAAKKDKTKQDKYIFQQCRIVSFQSYGSKFKEGGIELLKKELMKVFPDLYS